jgi:hypothetical protein
MRLGGPQSRSGRYEESNSNASVFQPIDRLCTDWAIAAPNPYSYVTSGQVNSDVGMMVFALRKFSVVDVGALNETIKFNQTLIGIRTV